MFDSFHVWHLVQEWALGGITANGVQREALQSYKDECRVLRSLGISTDRAHHTLAHLAGLGSFGKNLNNCRTELLTFLGCPSTPAPLMHKIHVKVMKVESEERTPK